MEFNEKLQELRKRKGLTQEELAEALYVSRTAVSKWESGRGYPNIDSLKEIAKYFAVTVDELLSSDELLIIAEEDQKQKERNLYDLIFGSLDIVTSLLFFLPFFAEKTDIIRSYSLLTFNGVQPYVKALYIVVLLATVVFGILTFALQNCRRWFWLKYKSIISIGFNFALVLLFILSLQPYPSVFIFVLLAIKVVLLLKRQ